MELMELKRSELLDKLPDGSPRKGLRIGLFGGTFNPIHIGHLRAGIEVKEAFGLDRLVWIPSARPPHKSVNDVAQAQHRLEMVRRSVQGIAGFDVSDVELKQTGPSYTINTLRHFQSKFGPESELYFVVGQDAFDEVPTWMSYQDLFAVSNFIVMARPRADHCELKFLESFIQEQVSDEYKASVGALCYTHPRWRSIFLLNITQIDVSASNVRDRIRHGNSIRFLVPQVVEEYIMEKALYR